MAEGCYAHQRAAPITTREVYEGGSIAGRYHFEHAFEIKSKKICIGINTDSFGYKDEGLLYHQGANFQYMPLYEGHLISRKCHFAHNVNSELKNVEQVINFFFLILLLLLE